MSLSEYCISATETATIEAFEKEGTKAGAARLLGKDVSNTRKVIQRVEARAYTQGYSKKNGMDHQIPETHFLKGVSTYEKGGPEDNFIGRWIKTDKKSGDIFAGMMAAAAALSEDIPQVEPVTPPQRIHNEKLLVLYVLTDYHLGMMAWGEETRGLDWDLKIAEETMVKWFQATIAAAPDAETAVLGQLGDFLHWDSMDKVTPGHGHHLDGDSRSQKMVRVAIRVMARVISMLLQKHKYVKIIAAQGNHDLYSSAWMRESLDFYYQNEPRVFVDVSPDPYYCIEFGNVGLYFHHGHKRNISGLPSVFVQKFKETYGRTKYSYGHTGHRHHKHVKECNLMIMEQHQTLAPADAYSSSGGYHSESGAQATIYHADFGETGTIRFTPEMLKD